MGMAVVKPGEQKKHYRQRAHANPFSDHTLVYPASPGEMRWETVFAGGGAAEWADIGCGFGGLLVALGRKFPELRVVGLELRVQVTAYVEDRIAALRVAEEGKFGNIGVLRTNAMRFLPNIFGKESLSALFFLFPDPHFKTRKHKARIISPTLLAEYAYVLRVGGIVYTITDVEDLHLWMLTHLSQFPLFEYVDPDTLRAEGHGPVLDAVYFSTEEGIKVDRNGGKKWLACFRRIHVQR